MNACQWIVLAHAFATIAMTGLIWFVQVVHYPLFPQVGESHFTSYAADHVRRTGYVVAPLMLTELACAGWLAYCPPTPDVAWSATTGLLLLLVIWLSTALAQVPCHRQLERGLNHAAVRRLVATNWIRTALWSARAVLALQLVVGSLLTH